jgi:hypothetical protein
MDDKFQSQMKETRYCDMTLKSWNMEIREEPQRQPLLCNILVKRFHSNAYAHNSRGAVGGIVY